MAFIMAGYDSFEDSDKNFDLVLCPYGNRKPCTYHCAKLRVRTTPDGKRFITLNCGGKPPEIELLTQDEWRKRHPPKDIVHTNQICDNCKHHRTSKADPDDIVCMLDGSYGAKDFWCEHWEAEDSQNSQ